MAMDHFASTIFDLRSDYAQGNEMVVDIPGTDRYRNVRIATVKNPRPDANGLLVAHDDLRHSVSTSKLRVPWALQPDPNLKSEPVLAKRADVKGDWLNGRRLFFRDAGCATCHTIRSEGFSFGPDLSNLIYRDRQSVLHDIREPSATINPDHPGTLVTLRDGTSASGIVRSEKGEKITLDLPAGAVADIPRAKIASVAPMTTSLMTQGLLDQFNPEQVEDLLTFLLINPLEPAPITRLEPPTPPARSLSDLQQVLVQRGLLPRVTDRACEFCFAPGRKIMAWMSMTILFGWAAGPGCCRSPAMSRLKPRKASQRPNNCHAAMWPYFLTPTQHGAHRRRR